MTSSTKASEQLLRVGEWLKLLRTGEVSAAHRPSFSLQKRLQKLDNKVKAVYSPLHNAWVLMKKTPYGFWGILLQAPESFSQEDAINYFENKLKEMKPDMKAYEKWLNKQAYLRMKALEKWEEEWRREVREKVHHTIRKVRDKSKTFVEV